MAQTSFCMSCNAGVSCCGSMLLPNSVSAVLKACTFWVAGYLQSLEYLDAQCLSKIQSRLPAEK